MKRTLFICVLLVLVLGTAPAVFAQGNDVVAGWDSYFNPGNVALSAGVGLGGFFYGFGLNLYPGVEVTILRPKFGDVVPMSFGIAAKGLFGFYPGAFQGLDVGVSALGTAHLSLKGLALNSKFLNSLDFYVGLGISIFFLRPYLGAFFSPVQFASFQGVNYFFSDSFAVYLESSYMGLSYYWVTLGALFKLGK